jgi:hypothetical protein
MIFTKKCRCKQIKADVCAKSEIYPQLFKKNIRDYVEQLTYKPGKF